MLFEENSERFAEPTKVIHLSSPTHIFFVSEAPKPAEAMAGHDSTGGSLLTKSVVVSARQDGDPYLGSPQGEPASCIPEVEGLCVYHSVPCPRGHNWQVQE